MKRGRGPRRSPRARPMSRASVGPSSPQDPHPKQDPDGAKTVTPGDLLAFLVAAAVVGDGELVDTQLAPAHLARDLRLDPELVLAQVERHDHLAAKRLVARLHVGEGRVEEDAGEQREEAVAEQVPEE